jgi:hypothetical protein
MTRSISRPRGVNFEDIEILYREMALLYERYLQNLIAKEEYLRRIRPLDERVDILESEILKSLIYGGTEFEESPPLSSFGEEKRP